MPIVAVNEQLFIQFSLHKPHLFHFSTKKGKLLSQLHKIGQQGTFSRADTLNNSTNKRLKGCPIKKKL